MAAETTITSAAAWRPDAFTYAPSDAIPDAIILQTSTVAGFVEGDAPTVRVAFVNDAAADFVAEGAEISEANPELAEVLVPTGKVSLLYRLSREQMAQPGANQKLSESVARAVVKKANSAYLAQAAPVSPATRPAAGLLNNTGIVDGGAIAANLDGLVDLIADLETNGATPSHIVVSPTAWASLRKFKTGTGSAAALLGAGAEDAVRMLLDLPVLVTPALTGANGLVLDKSAIASAVGQVQVAQSEHFYFGSDSIALRCTWRFGHNLVHADRIGKFTVTAPEA